MRTGVLAIVGFLAWHGVNCAADQYSFYRNVEFISLSKSFTLTRASADRTEVAVIKSEKALERFLQAYALTPGDPEALETFKPMLGGYDLLVIFGNGNGAMEVERLSERSGTTQIYADVRYAEQKWKRAAPPDGQTYSSYAIVAMHKLKGDYSYFIRLTNPSASPTKTFN